MSFYFLVTQRSRSVHFDLSGEIWQDEILTWMGPHTSHIAAKKNYIPPPPLHAFLKLLLFLIQRGSVLNFSEQSSLQPIVIAKALMFLLERQRTRRQTVLNPQQAKRENHRHQKCQFSSCFPAQHSRGTVKKLQLWKSLRCLSLETQASRSALQDLKPWVLPGNGRHQGFGQREQRLILCWGLVIWCINSCLKYYSEFNINTIKNFNFNITWRVYDLYICQRCFVSMKKRSGSQKNPCGRFISTAEHRYCYFLWLQAE